MPMSEIRDYDVALAMVTYGGSFVAALGQAWMRADEHNGQKIKAAFPEYWDEYREFVQFKAKQAQA
jgi:hypothetical protein